MKWSAIQRTRHLIDDYVKAALQSIRNVADVTDEANITDEAILGVLVEKWIDRYDS